MYELYFIFCVPRLPGSATFASWRTRATWHTEILISKDGRKQEGDIYVLNYISLRSN